MNPIILSWMAGNVAGTTKKAVSTSLYKAADSAGNIVGEWLGLSVLPIYRRVSLTDLLTTPQGPLLFKVRRTPCLCACSND